MQLQNSVYIYNKISYGSVGHGVCFAMYLRMYIISKWVFVLLTLHKTTNTFQIEEWSYIEDVYIQQKYCVVQLGY